MNGGVAAHWSEIRIQKMAKFSVKRDERMDRAPQIKEMLMEQERADKLQKFSRWEAFKIKKDVIIKDYIRAVRKMRRATGFVKH